MFLYKDVVLYTTAENMVNTICMYNFVVEYMFFLLLISVVNMILEKEH